MSEVSSTVFFDGQFWIAIIEKIGDDGIVRVGKHTFGPEPANSDLKFFYLYVFPSLPCAESDIRIRVKSRRGAKERERITCKSRDAYKEIQKKLLCEKAGIRRLENDEREKARFARKQEKKKEKRKGH